MFTWVPYKIEKSKELLLPANVIEKVLEPEYSVIDTLRGEDFCKTGPGARAKADAARNSKLSIFSFSEGLNLDNNVLNKRNKNDQPHKYDIYLKKEDLHIGYKQSRVKMKKHAAGFGVNYPIPKASFSTRERKNSR